MTIANVAKKHEHVFGKDAKCACGARIIEPEGHKKPEKWAEVDEKRRIAVTNLVSLLAVHNIRQAALYQAWGDAESARDVHALAHALEAARDYLVGATTEMSDG